MKPLPLLTLLACFAAAPALAQTVWRCGADGRVFQATPCAEGQAMSLKPAPSAAAVAEAHAVVERERQALQTLAAERRARELAAVPGPAGIQRLVTETDTKAPKRKPVRPSSPRPQAEA
jgi:hypothetical protein